MSRKLPVKHSEIYAIQIIFYHVYCKVLFLWFLEEAFQFDIFTLVCLLLGVTNLDGHLLVLCPKCDKNKTL